MIKMSFKEKLYKLFRSINPFSPLREYEEGLQELITAYRGEELGLRADETYALFYFRNLLSTNHPAAFAVEEGKSVDEQLAVYGFTPENIRVMGAYEFGRRLFTDTDYAEDRMRLWKEKFEPMLKS